MSRRIVVAETWHNPDWDFARMVRNLSGRIRGNDDTEGVPSSWAWAAIRIATLFGLYGELLRQGLTTPDARIDVAVTAGDFSSPIAVWYAREMGLPIGTIVTSCNENCGVWDLLHHGELRTDAVAHPTNTPECDIGVADSLERLIYGCLGIEQVQQFAFRRAEGIPYTPGEEGHAALRKGFYAAVVSQKRMESVIYNVYRTSTYLKKGNCVLARCMVK